MQARASAVDEVRTVSRLAATTCIGGDRMGYHDKAKWKRQGWAYRVETPDDLMRTIGRLSTMERKRRYAWRGVRNIDYRVQSSLTRHIRGLTDDAPAEPEVRKWELGILAAARKWGLEISLGEVASDLHLLCLLQHHGIPTRLVDFTYNPMTALWFAAFHADDDGTDRAGCLLALDVTTLPSFSSVDLARTWGSLEDPLGWTLRNALDQSASGGQPFVVVPSLPDARMIRQEGLFVAGAIPDTPDVEGLDEWALMQSDPPGAKALASLFDLDARPAGRPRRLPLVVIEIAPRLKKRMREHLAVAFNTTRASLFPDLSGFAEAWRAGEVSMD